MSGIRNQVQLSLNDAELATLTELVEMVKSDQDAWRRFSWRRITRSSVVMELVKSEINRRKDLVSQIGKPKKK